MIRWLIGFGLLASLALTAKPINSSLKIKTGKAAPYGPKQLENRDGEVVSITSDKVVNSQIIEFSMLLPTPTLPERIGSATLAMAIEGSRAQEISVSVWLPKSRVWNKLPSEYLPTTPKGLLMLKLFRPERILAGDEVEFLVRLEDHEFNADPLNVKIDAARIIVTAADQRKAVADAHAAAAKDKGDEPLVRVHSFAGQSSGNYDSKRNALAKSFREKPPPPKNAPSKKKKKKKR
jgi:hypothetical protein